MKNYILLLLGPPRASDSSFIPKPRSSVAGTSPWSVFIAQKRQTPGRNGVPQRGWARAVSMTGVVDPSSFSRFSRLAFPDLLSPRRSRRRGDAVPGSRRSRTKAGGRPRAPPSSPVVRGGQRRSRRDVRRAVEGRGEAARKLDAPTFLALRSHRFAPPAGRRRRAVRERGPRNSCPLSPARRCFFLSAEGASLGPSEEKERRGPPAAEEGRGRREAGTRRPPARRFFRLFLSPPNGARG
jgi:hypothetical protein